MADHTRQCPWCGSSTKLSAEALTEDVQAGRVEITETTTYYFVECESCGASGPLDTDDKRAIERWHEVA